MKILFVTPDPIEYNSSANLRNRGLIQGFVEDGHSVSTLSLSPQDDAISGECVRLPGIDKRYFIPLNAVHSKLTSKKSDGGVSRRIKRYLYGLYNRFSVYDSRIRYVESASRVVLSEKYDLMISSSDPKSAHRIAEALMKSNPGRIGKWVQYWGDPFASDINVVKGFKYNAIVREEGALLSLADAVVYVSPLTEKEIKKQYVEYQHKIHFIPPPYATSRIYPSVSCTVTKLLYAGDYHRRDRNIQPLLDAVNNMKDVELLLVGKTDISQLRSHNIKPMDRMPIEDIYGLEANTNILICLSNKLGNQIPGKFFQVAATNRPILLVLDGENAELIREYFSSFSRYEICDNTTESIISALDNIRNGDSNDLRPVDAFSSVKVARQFLKLCNG